LFYPDGHTRWWTARCRLAERRAAAADLLTARTSLRPDKLFCYFNIDTSDQCAKVAFGTVNEIGVTIDGFQPSRPALVSVHPSPSEQSKSRRATFWDSSSQHLFSTLHFRLIGSSRFTSDLAGSSANSPKMSIFRACTVQHATTIIKIDGGAIAFQFASIDNTSRRNHVTPSRLLQQTSKEIHDASRNDWTRAYGQ
jgi:hypothetical protein